MLQNWLLKSLVKPFGMLSPPECHLKGHQARAPPLPRPRGSRQICRQRNVRHGSVPQADAPLLAEKPPSGFRETGGCAPEKGGNIWFKHHLYKGRIIITSGLNMIKPMGGPTLVPPRLVTATWATSPLAYARKAGDWVLVPVSATSFRAPPGRRNPSSAARPAPRPPTRLLDWLGLRGEHLPGICSLR